MSYIWEFDWPHFIANTIGIMIGLLIIDAVKWAWRKRK